MYLKTMLLVNGASNEPLLMQTVEVSILYSFYIRLEMLIFFAFYVIIFILNIA